MHANLAPPTMPDGSKRTRRNPTFNTLEREKSFINPPKDGLSYDILNEFVTPHIESFNALFDDSGLPVGDGDGRGIISLAIKDIGERVVFDGNGHESDSRGNRISSAFSRTMLRSIPDFACISVWIDQATISKPQVTDRSQAIERRVFPSEVWPYVHSCKACH